MASVVSRPLNTLFSGGFARGKCVSERSPRQVDCEETSISTSCLESLKCFDDSFLDSIDDADYANLGSYQIVIE